MPYPIAANALTQKRYDIEALRGLAILLVLLYHAFPQFIPFGYLGVDLFFCISGFVITQKLVTLPVINLADFFQRRIRRLFPSLITVLFFCLAIGGAVVAHLGLYMLETDLLNSLFHHITAASLFLTNIKLISEVGYFDQAAQQKPLLHLWSLGVEMQFYLFWPILIKLTPKQYYKHLCIVILILALTIWGFLSTQIDQALAFYLPITRMSEFMVGALFAINANSIKAPNTQITFSLRPLIALGGISYALYLWHWPLLVLANFLAPLDFVITATVLCLSIILAILTTRFIERPIQKQKINVKLTSLLLIVLLTVGVIAYSLALLGKPLNRGDTLWREHSCFWQPEDFSQTSFREECIGKQTKDLNNLILWGDSHAAMYSPPLQTNNKIAFTQLTATACPPYITPLTEDKECTSFILASVKAFQIIGDNEKTWVALGGHWREKYNEKALGETIAWLKSQGINAQHIVLIGPAPEWRNNLAQNLLTYFLREKELSLSMNEGLDLSLANLDMQMSAFAQKQEVRYLTIYQQLCTPLGCQVLQPDGDRLQLTSFDYGHLTPIAAQRVLMPLLTLLDNKTGSRN